MIMALIGFAAVVLIGASLIIAGAQAERAMLAFTGKVSGAGCLVALVGVAMVVLAFKYAPFTIAFGVSA